MPPNALAAYGADNLGVVGAWALLESWQVQHADHDFSRRAHEASAAAAISAAAFNMTSSVPWAFLAFDIGVLGLHGQWLGVSRRSREDMVVDPVASLVPPLLLRAFPLAINKSVDRSVCAEFQLLSRMAKTLAIAKIRLEMFEEVDAVSSGSSGNIKLFVSGTPCLSCLGAVLQFR
eukprot:CAMPEP_0169320332 /NCGR_PEP_ID=MMETSP1017-20121227/8301_1 /TAXON_ID=342587 /ORGANISM="Karlodinium micrum, Strain CCMP2283" /LENGTH=175 /DNA_ID=CAMNT_0009414743 /DNA_START=377 /DNA_END=901 /DNA_ORIENTATION=-